MPALYSAWLRLWGAKVGALVYWSPGVGISDRQLVEVGRRVVLGMGARLHAHVITRGEGEGGGAPTELLLAPVQIGDDTLVGGMSLLTPGVRVAPGEVTPGVYALPPFSEWRGGKRVRHRPETLS